MHFNFLNHNIIYLVLILWSAKNIADKTDENDIEFKLSFAKMKKHPNVDLNFEYTGLVLIIVFWMLFIIIS